MIARAVIVACLVGCAAPPPPEPEGNAFLPPAGRATSRPAGVVLSSEPPSVRLTDPARDQPAGYRLVARDPSTLRPTGILRVISARGPVARVSVERGRARPGDEVVEPAPALAAEAARLPPA